MNTRWIASADLFSVPRCRFRSRHNDKERSLSSYRRRDRKQQARRELFRHLTFITLRLASMRRDFPFNGEPSSTLSLYSRSMDALTVHNSKLGRDSRGWELWWTLLRISPELSRDGDIVSYTKEVQEQVATAERARYRGMAAVGQRRLSRGGNLWLFVDLKTWYQMPLPPLSINRSETIRPGMAIGPNQIQ